MDRSYPKTQPATPIPKLEEAIKLAKAGQKVEAHHLLRKIVAVQPVNQAAWLWLSAMTPDRGEAEAALAQARKINPAHHSLSRAEQWLAKRFSSQPLTKKTPTVRSATPDVAAPVPNKANNLSKLFHSFAVGLMIVSIMVGLAALFLGITFDLSAPVQAGSDYDDEAFSEFAVLDTALEEAWAKKDWGEAITILERLEQMPVEATFIQERLAQAHLERGLGLRYQGFVDRALDEFEQALVVAPEDLHSQQEIALAKSYLAGKQYYQDGRWSDVIAALEEVYAVDPAYPDVKDLLFSAYYNQGLALRAAEEFRPAMAAFEAAVTLRPDLAAPRRQITELEFALTPETLPALPMPSVPIEDRLIVVGIAEQRMYVYEGNKKIFDFIVSTGEPGRDTITGEFEIQNKIDLAYASTWNLDMPYWLGIYWAGPLQNGIHSLPTVRHTGHTLWDGYLGQRVSYGCIILGEEDAATLYEWAEVGAKVKIVPSLADWSLGE